MVVHIFRDSTFPRCSNTFCRVLRHLQAKVEYLEHENAQKDWQKNPLEKMEPPQIGMMMKETFYGKQIQLLKYSKVQLMGLFLAKHVREARNKSRWEHLQSHDFHGNYCYTDLRSHVWEFFSNQTLSFHLHNTWSTWNQQNLHLLPLRCRWNLGYRMTGVENVTRREFDGVISWGTKFVTKLGWIWPKGVHISAAHVNRIIGAYPTISRMKGSWFTQHNPGPMCS